MWIFALGTSAQGFFAARAAPIVRRGSRFVLLLVLAAAAVFPLAPVGGGRACAGGTNHAGEAIRFSPTEERRFCIDFSEQEISGIRALRLTGLPVVTKTHPQYGEFVCKIGEVGHDSSDCPAADGSYWAYFYLHSAGIWYPWSQGASSARVRCGAAEGWAWFPRGVGAPPSAPASFASICSGRTCQQESSPAPEVTAGPAGAGSGSPRPGSSPTAGKHKPDGVTPSLVRVTPDAATPASPSNLADRPRDRGPTGSASQPKRPALAAGLAAALVVLGGLGVYFQRKMKGSRGRDSP